MFSRLLIICILITSYLPELNGQVKRIISDPQGNQIGEFEVLLIQKVGAKEQVFTSEKASLYYNGKEKGEFSVRFQNLKWKNEDNKDAILEMRKSTINLSDKNGISISAKGRNFKLKPGPIALDITFEASKNGSYNIVFGYEVDDLAKSRFTKSFIVSGLEAKTVEADVKSLWKKIDKNDTDDLANFYQEHFAGSNNIKDTNILSLLIRALSAHKSKLKSYSDQKGDYELYLKVFPEEKAKVASDLKEKEKEEEKKESQTKDEKKEKENQTKDEKKEKVVEENPVDAEVSLKTKAIGHNQYRISFENVENLSLKSKKEDIEVIDETSNYIDLELKESKSYRIALVGEDQSKDFKVNIDNTFKAGIKQEDEGIAYKIRGGDSPFRVVFKKDEEKVASREARFEDLTPDKNGEIFISNNEMSASGMEGNYANTTIVDKSTELKKSFGIDLMVEKKRSKTLMFLMIGLGVILLIGLLLYLNNKKKAKTRKEYLQKAKDLTQQSPPVAAEATTAAAATTTPVGSKPKKITISKSSKRHIQTTNDYTSSGKMKIKWKESTGGGEVSKEIFDSLISSQKFCKLNVNQHWPDSTISNVYMSGDCIKNLGKFLREENLHGISNEMQGAIPEVGGFLMGKHSSEDGANFEVTIDKFVPFVPEYHDVFKIEIGTQTLVQELGDAQDNHPELSLIGWFHTHPGHGLFLSNSDLSVQKHFPQHYQLAMEIDSLTERLDTAFFTRSQNGHMNNVRDIREKTWFAWKEIEKTIS